ncbi:MAG TPA: TrbI/VirB10 family protein [Luteolibacter sp.]
MKNKLIRFAKTKHGKFFGFLIIAFIVLGLVSQLKKPGGAPKTIAKAETAPASGVVKDSMQTEGYKVERGFVPAFDNVSEQRAAIAAQKLKDSKGTEVEAKKASADKKPVPIGFLPLKIEKSKPAPEEGGEGEPAGLEENPTLPLVNPKDSFAPYGRMLRSKLVTTVDSSNISSPIIGMVTHDLFWNQKLLIPANSEIHAIARPDRSRNRIDVSGRWVIILADGGVYPASSEIIVDGIALDMDVNTQCDQFSITDGSAGLRGTVLTNEDGLNTIKLFTATFLSGVADGVTEREQTYGGTQTVPGLQSGGTQGMKAVMDRYAERILALIERDGAYVRVPAGKQFYLYIKQPLIMEKAKLGATLAKNELEIPVTLPPPQQIVLPAPPPKSAAEIEAQDLENQLLRARLRHELRELNQEKPTE